MEWGRIIKAGEGQEHGKWGSADKGQECLGEAEKAEQPRERL